MLEAPLRHLIFVLGLLFIILSSGSLQCALHCYETPLTDESNSALVTSFHPLSFEREELPSMADFCHHSHSTSQTQADSQLFSLSRGQLLAWSGSRSYAPLFRCAKPVQLAPFILVVQQLPTQNGQLPLRLEQIRTTILII